MGFVLSLMEKNKKNQEKKMAAFAESKRGQKALNSKRMVQYREKRLKAMQPDVEKRFREESDHSKGEQVWFSRYILNGRLRHWVLMTHGNKYELRRSQNVGEEKQEERAGESKFTYHVIPCTIDEQKRNAALAETHQPDVDGFYVCLIGWTRLSKQQVDDACKATYQGFGEYNLLWRNCQDFLRSLAQQIIIAKAADWNWFNTNTKTRYQKTQSLMPPPLEYLLKLSQAQASMMQATLQNQAQIQAQTQMQSQMNTQIQMQIQMQIQQQIMQQQMTSGGGMGA